MLPPVVVQEITCPVFAETIQETFPYIYAALPVIAAPDWQMVVSPSVILRVNPYPFAELLPSCWVNDTKYRPLAGTVNEYCV